jgi:hypothetical protein
MNEKLKSSDFLICNQSKDAFESMFSNFEFWNVNNQNILFWQPLKWRVLDRFHDADKSDKTLDDLVDILLEHDNIKIDSHCYIPYDKPFHESLKFYC